MLEIGQSVHLELGVVSCMTNREYVGWGGLFESINS